MALRGARRGRFGRLPAAAPDLTNTIISIAREMQRQQDQNLMDAWQKGGTFEGKPATDSMVLAHWKQRLAGVDKNDPLHDTYSNTLLQYDYAIHESKQSTLYAQGKISDKQMAGFYLGWAKKVPRDSEFYRVLQRDGAQFMRASAAKGKAGARAAQEKTYQDGQQATSNKYEKVGQYLTDTMTNLAHSYALIGSSGGNDDLRNFDTGDPAALLKLISTVNGQSADGRPGTVSSGVLYHDPITGKGITAADIYANIKKLDPSFTGNFTLSYYSKTLQSQLAGQAIRLEAATKTGHAGDANNIQKWQQYTSEIGREANAWPIEQHYNIIRDQFMATWSNPAATADMKLASWNTYRQALIDTANSKRNVPDDNTKTRLLAEANGDGSVDSLAETFTGLNSQDHTTTGGSKTLKGDIASLHQDLATYQQWHEQAATGAGFWAQGKTGHDAAGNLVFTPGDGTEIGLTTVVPPADAVRVFLPQGNGQPPIPVYMQGKPVTVTVVTPDGYSIASTTPHQQQVATAYDTVVNGQPVRMYAYTNSEGKQLYTQDPPWNTSSPSVRTTASGSGINVTITLAAAPNAANAAGGTLFTPITNASGAVTGYTVNAAAALLATSPDREKAGANPIEDSFSPTLAMLASSPDAAKTLSALASNPDFQKQINNEMNFAAGATWTTDGKGGGAWTGGNQALLSQYQSQANMLTHIPELKTDISNLLAGAFKAFNRGSTTGTFAASAPVIDGSKGNESLKAAVLPADQVGETAFHALGAVFQNGTTNFLPGDTRSEGLQIKMAGTIKTPAAPTVAPAPTPSPAPSPTPITVNPSVPPPSGSTLGAPPPTFNSSPPGGNSTFYNRPS